MDHIDVIDKILELRERLGISRRKMAGMINVHRNTLSNWGKKKNVPSRLAIRKMKEILIYRPVWKEEKTTSGRVDEILKLISKRRKEESSDIGEKNK